MNASWRNAPAPDCRSMLREDAAWKIASGVGRQALERPAERRRRPRRRRTPIRPIPIPHAERERQPLAERARDGPAEAEQRTPGRRGQGIAPSRPRSRRANASTPTANRTIATQRSPAASDAQSNCADERAGGGRSSRTRSGSRTARRPGPRPDSRWRSSRTGGPRRAIAGRGAAPDERRRARRRRTPKPARRRRPTGANPRRRGRRDRVAGAASPNGIRRRRCEAVTRTTMAMPGEVGGELLERDPALAERRRGDELEAAAAGLGRERPGQRERSTTGAAIRPSEAPVLPGDRAAERLDGGRERVAVQAGHRRRQGADEVVRAPSRDSARREGLGRTRRRSRAGRPPSRPADDDEREARVAERLARRRCRRP